MAEGMQKDWRELCLAVTNETDPLRSNPVVLERCPKLLKRSDHLKGILRRVTNAP
jgi:hypothetical protein